MAVEPDWPQLPKELLEMISDRLTGLGDHVRFRAVCRSWASIRPPSSIWENKFYRFSSREFLGKRCCGSSYGWLALLDGTPEILLFNPLTEEKILLPSLTRLPEVLEFHEKDEEYLYQDFMGEHHTVDMNIMKNFFVHRIALSGDPTLVNQNSWAALCYDLRANRLAFCKIHDKSWTVLQDQPSRYVDFLIHKEKLYAVDSTGRVIICDLGSPENLVIVQPVSVSGSRRRYLVELRGALLMVCVPMDNVVNLAEEENFYEALLDSDYSVIYDSEDGGRRPLHMEYKNRALWFHVFELDEVERRLVKVNNLGNHALFLSQNYSLSLLASEVPGCRGNCIYYLDGFTVKGGTNTKKGYELCRFNLKSGATQYIITLVLHVPDHCHPFGQDTWFIPSSVANWMPKQSSQLAAEDSITWIPNVKGNFFIKSALDINGQISFPGPLKPHEWKALMQVNLPRRLQLLLWRVACGVLPAKMVAKTRYLVPESPCPFCHQVRESLEHLLLSCQFTQAAWLNSAWPLHISALENTRLADWIRIVVNPSNVLGINGNEAKKFLAYVVMFVVHLWGLRNWLAASGEEGQPLVFARALNVNYGRFLQVWDFRQESEFRGAKWVPPPRNKVKVNFDVAICLDFAMLAMTCRDNEGRFLLAWTERLPACDLIVGEAKAAFLAVSTAIEYGFTKIIVEGNDPAVIQPLQHWKTPPSRAIANVIADIRTLLGSTVSWRVTYVSVMENLATHNLACWAAFYDRSGSIPVTSLPFCVIYADDRGCHPMSGSKQAREWSGNYRPTHPY
ncbi:uncharacterized protein LOC115734410 isoform X2 [Rhodamnia argentea]|uniref:Uncharacterized protein LOC115734410 isoform X2 n=1 Tax=Rhodamnia argentea TaxID=178133 RepID=A0ABM3HGQ2_9MYRT|nr:uncharacterized protein LOC115734410 isoform X2 [Rhodamnia argentea]